MVMLKHKPITDVGTKYIEISDTSICWPWSCSQLSVFVYLLTFPSMVIKFHPMNSMEFPLPIVRFQQEADLLKKHDRSMATGQEPAVVAKEDLYVAT